MFFCVHYGLSDNKTAKSKLPAKTKIVEENKDRGWFIIESPVPWETLIRLFEGTEITVGIDHRHQQRTAK